MSEEKPKAGNREWLAAILVFSTTVEKDARFFPTTAEVKKILLDPPPRFEEALALANLIVDTILETEPMPVGTALRNAVSAAETIHETAQAFAEDPKATITKMIFGAGGRR